MGESDSTSTAVVPESPREVRRARWRRRGWAARRVGVVVLTVATFAVLGAGLVHSYQTWALPDAPEPFDLAAFEAEPPLPDEINARTLFAEARRAVDNTFAAIGPIRQADWSKAKPEARAWVEANRPALETWRRGTDRDRYRPRAVLLNSEDLEDYTALTHWLTAAFLEATRLEDAGDLDRAWTWHKARIRACLLLAHRVPFFQRSGLATHFLDDTIRASRDWAERPGTAPPGLRRAITDLEALGPIYPPASETLKVEYLWTRRAFDDPRSIHVQAHSMRGRPPVGAEAESLPVLLGNAIRPGRWWLDDYLHAEPDRSVRAARLAFADWIAAADRPKADREVVSRSPLVFADGPGPLGPDALAAFEAGSPLWSVVRRAGEPTPFPWRLDDWPAGLDTDRRSVAGLIVALASRIREIETGKPPLSADELVGTVLPRLPDDYAPPDAGPPER